MAHFTCQQGTCYEIKIQGALDDKWSDWFSGMTISVDQGAEGRPCTILSGRVSDQARLRGILCKIWDLNLTLIAVNLIGE